jgi:alcohol dehydrogenase
VTYSSRSLYLIAPHTLKWQQETLPRLGVYDVLLETLAGSISIGSELPQYRGDERLSNPRYPRMTGYENYARVISVGESVIKVKADDLVFAFYGHRTHAVLHEDRPVLVPPQLSAEYALSAILTCDVTKGIRKLNPLPDTKVLITGGGAIGLFTVAMLKAYGVMRIDMVEPLAYRQHLATELGATHAYTPQDTLPNDYEMAFECSSRQSAFALLQVHLAHHGKLCILADGNIEPLILLPDFHHKELTIVGSSDGWDYHRHARWFFKYVQREKPPLSKLFDVRIKHTQLPDTFAQLADGSLSAVKVLVDYQVV